ncbi:hypothetical protein LptCag_2143 [Leptospirillum ferriphilum]|uniref:Uncharacterized protein n=1 Tax=Leptospirillum ferriphilum TaxID=178606 RepID=A0A094WAZ7_9BACT|nr:hypothetical protein LptCag_2143 [Leptospirillum ferriphilum]
MNGQRTPSFLKSPLSQQSHCYGNNLRVSGNRFLTGSPHPRHPGS